MLHCAQCDSSAFISSEGSYPVAAGMVGGKECRRVRVSETPRGPRRLDYLEAPVSRTACWVRCSISS